MATKAVLTEQIYQLEKKVESYRGRVIELDQLEQVKCDLKTSQLEQDRLRKALKQTSGAIHSLVDV